MPIFLAFHLLCDVDLAMAKVFIFFVYFLHAPFFSELIEKNIWNTVQKKKKSNAPLCCCITQTHHPLKRINGITMNRNGLNTFYFLVFKPDRTCMKNQVLAHEIENSSQEALEWHSIDKTNRRINGSSRQWGIYDLYTTIIFHSSSNQPTKR